MITVKISSLPTNIKNDNSHLPESGTKEKFPAGPVNPNPGPTLLKHVIDEPIEVVKSSPISVRRKMLIINIIA